MHEFKLKVQANGNYWEEDLKDYIAFEVGAVGSIDPNNPFVDEDQDAEIVSIDIE